VTSREDRRASAGGQVADLAFFAVIVEDLIDASGPAVETTLLKCGISASLILVSVCYEKHTTNDDIREFNLLGVSVASLC
jgi:hypothetical protein